MAPQPPELMPYPPDINLSEPDINPSEKAEFQKNKPIIILSGILTAIFAVLTWGLHLYNIDKNGQIVFGGLAVICYLSYLYELLRK